jgi:transcriptional regulator with XRE-family HTH domain
MDAAAHVAHQLSLWEYLGMRQLSGRDFYERVVEAFTDASLSTTQTAIAEAAGLQQPAVSKWKQGESFPGYDVAIRLAQRASVSVSWLWLGVGNKKNGGNMDDQTVALLDAWHRMPEQARVELLEYIRYRAASESEKPGSPPEPENKH